MRAYLGGTDSHPHKIEATRQVTGELFAKNGIGVFPGVVQAHLLYEPYMSPAGAAGLLSQTLTSVARNVDQEAEVRHFLRTAEFRAFHALVRSVYLGSLQKRAEHAEKSKRPGGTQTAVQGEGGSSQQPPNKARPLEGERQAGNGGGSNVSGPAQVLLGIAPESHQACSSDIAQALVAIAMGEGFERFRATRGGDVEGEAGADAVGESLSTGKGRTRAPGNVPDQYGGGIGGGLGRKGSLENADSNGVQRILKYLSENAPVVEGMSPNGEEDEQGVQLARAEARFPDLEWLAPHIVGRSIPITLRCLFVFFLRCDSTFKPSNRRYDPSKTPGDSRLLVAPLSAPYLSTTAG